MGRAQKQLSDALPVIQVIHVALEAAVQVID